MTSCKRAGCGAPKSGSSPFCSLDCMDEATVCAFAECPLERSGGSDFCSIDCADAAKCGILRTAVPPVCPPSHTMTKSYALDHIDKPELKALLAGLDDDDQDLALTLTLDRDRVMETSSEEFTMLAKNLVRLAEQLGVKECPIPLDSHLDIKDRTPLFRVHRDDGLANTGMWWFLWSLQDVGWHSYPRGCTDCCQVCTVCSLMIRLVLNPELQLPPRSGLDVEGKDVLELGMGLGMLGITAATKARRVVITDGDQQSLHLAQINANLNGQGRVQVDYLRWSRTSGEAFRDKFGRFDRIVGADIVYSLEAAQPLFECVDELLTMEPGGSFTMGWGVRHNDPPNIPESIAAAAKACAFVEVAPAVSLVKLLTPTVGHVTLPLNDLDLLLFEFKRSTASPS